MQTVGFVGLGVMGAPMAAHLARSRVAQNLETLVYNRTPGKDTLPRQAGAQNAPDLKTLAAQSQAVILCVTRSEDVQNLLAQILPHARPGLLVVDHSTIAPAAAQAIHADLAAQGHHFLDAPITGGSMGAHAGTLTVFCGGDPETFALAQPLLEPYSKRVELVGGPGAGQLLKCANQIAVGGALLALCESLAFAQAAGLDLHQTRDLLATGAAGSWALDNYGPKMLAKDWTPGFSVDNQLKDFAYCAQAAQALGLQIPGTDLVARLLQNLQDQGRGADTTAALFEVLTSKTNPGGPR